MSVPGKHTFPGNTGSAGNHGDVEAPVLLFGLIPGSAVIIRSTYRVNPALAPVHDLKHFCFAAPKPRDGPGSP